MEAVARLGDGGVNGLLPFFSVLPCESCHGGPPRFCGGTHPVRDMRNEQGRGRLVIVNVRPFPPTTRDTCAVALQVVN